MRCNAELNPKTYLAIFVHIFCLSAAQRELVDSERLRREAVIC